MRSKKSPILLKHDDVAQEAALPGRCDSRRIERGPRGRRLSCHACRHQSRNSLPVKLMKTVSSEGSATERSTTSKSPDSAAARPGQHAITALDVQLDALVHLARR